MSVFYHFEMPRKPLIIHPLRHKLCHKEQQLCSELPLLRFRSSQRLSSSSLWACLRVPKLYLQAQLLPHKNAFKPPQCCTKPAKHDSKQRICSLVLKYPADEILLWWCLSGLGVTTMNVRVFFFSQEQGLISCTTKYMWCVSLPAVPLKLTNPGSTLDVSKYRNWIWNRFSYVLTVS